MAKTKNIVRIVASLFGCALNSTAFQQCGNPFILSTKAFLKSSELRAIIDDETSCRSNMSRRSVMGITFATLLVPLKPAFAGIDVSGLPIEGGGNVKSVIAEQLNAGTTSGRLNEFKTNNNKPKIDLKTIDSNDTEENEIGIATFAYRTSPAFGPTLIRKGFGERYLYEDNIVAPDPKKSLTVSFEFPSDWLQLDKLLGGIQYVDQRNGDKLYILRAKLPDNQSLVTVPKSFFGNAIFDTKGPIVKSGVNVDEFKVKKSEILNDGSNAAAHRRVLIKYATITGNGLRTERRALVDSYQVNNVAYMLMTSSNAVKFEAMGKERETVDDIVDSFRIE